VSALVGAEKNSHYKQEVPSCDVQAALAGSRNIFLKY
jgi:hypothetical protein